ncbi:tripartite tricarboxylate transporter TctB family protein [Roseateles sp. DC23W]|uniref:Tripartite tricarboxylate transporter TctB family protein n=1 Tax=Pelomonas dachongensis TaxID=3299029 RepID=A0ABW7EUB1_9BURK
MKIKSQRDFWSGLMFLTVGLGFAWGATEYSFGTSAQPGPGYFPFGLGVLLALLGALVLFKALTLESEGGDPVGAIAWRPLLVILAAIALFAVALPRLGLICTLPLTITVASLAGSEFRWRDVLIACVVLTLGCWALFIVGLKLPIQLWPIYFNA